ncbi:VOC family protein [Paenibacillus kobensis]|uniref:VOC family protein n=1 Tax=Paenibacillus kobensis TaxID=59841 RepID=UPI000FD916E7|nr:VOC family protein [Paenibacillus kobensis]
MSDSPDFRVDSIALPVRNIVKSMDWYIKHFNLKLLWVYKKYASLTANDYSAPYVTLVHIPNMEPLNLMAGHEPCPVLNFFTSDIELVHEKLRASHVPVSNIEHHENALKRCLVTDPDGNFIGISSYPE